MCLGRGYCRCEYLNTCRYEAGGDLARSESLEIEAKQCGLYLKVTEAGQGLPLCTTSPQKLRLDEVILWSASPPTRYPVSHSSWAHPVSEITRFRYMSTGVWPSGPEQTKWKEIYLWGCVSVPLNSQAFNHIALLFLQWPNPYPFFPEDSKLSFALHQYSCSCESVFPKLQFIHTYIPYTISLLYHLYPPRCLWLTSLSIVVIAKSIGILNGLKLHSSQNRVWSDLPSQLLCLRNVNMPTFLYVPILFFLIKNLFIFRERGRKGEREGEKHPCVRGP